MHQTGPRVSKRRISTARGFLIVRHFPHPVAGYRFITDRNTYLALQGAGKPSQAIKVPLNIILTDWSTFKKSRKLSLPCCLTTRTSLPRPFRVPRARRVTASCAILVTLFQTKFVIILWFTPCTLSSGDFFLWLCFFFFGHNCRREEFWVQWSCAIYF